MQIKRQYARYQANRQAKIRLESKPDFIDCQIRDISLNGLQISLRLKLKKDKILKLTLRLAEEFTLDIKAWVVWHKAIDSFNVYGLYFTERKEQDKERIYRFIRRYCSEEINKQWQDEPKEKKGGEEMEDKRIFARFPVGFPLRFLNLENGREGEAQTQDISAKGMGLVTNEELSVNAPLEMWLQVPDKGEPLYTRGAVVWSNAFKPNKYRVGVNLERADLMGVSRVMRVI